MIYLKSKLKVIDNSGVDTVECIRIIDKKKYGSLGNFILVVIKKLSYNKLNKKLNKNKNVQKGNLYKGLIVQVKKSVKRFDGSTIKFNNNSLILVNNQYIPIGTRLSGVLPLEILFLKDNKKFISLALLIL